MSLGCSAALDNAKILNWTCGHPTFAQIGAVRRETFMLYNDDFVTSLPQDPIAAMSTVLRVLANDIAAGGSIPFDDIYEVRDLLLAIKETYNVKWPDRHSDIENVQDDKLVDALTELHRDLDIIIRDEQSVSRRQRFSVLLGSAFHYELSSADVDRIQVLVNELRDLISKNQKIEDDHRRRLLKRLEDLQKEIHKRLSDLDRFYGLMGEAGVALGKFGNDAKPFVDRIREIVQIVWRAQANAEQLPASARPAALTTEQESP